MRFKTQEQFIEAVYKLYGALYDYSKVQYTLMNTPIIIICKKHGEFLKKPADHLSGQGCPLCSNERVSKRQIEEGKQKFLTYLQNLNSNQYNFDKVKYVNSQTKVIITCKDHGDFLITPDNFKAGHGCAECSRSKKVDEKEFIKRAIKVHGDKYDYSNLNYRFGDKKINIICSIHGPFLQSKKNHLNGNGCPKCKANKISKMFKKSNDYFINELKNLYGDRFDYSFVEYKGDNEKVKLVCKVHSIFEKKAGYLLSGGGCQKCKSSKGEIKIRNILEKNNINFEEQKRFQDCRDQRPLSFDFYLPDYNFCIEFDGAQHSTKVTYFGGEDSFIDRQRKDKIKNDYCKNNNINLLRISYKDKECVEQILNNKILKDTQL